MIPILETATEIQERVRDAARGRRMALDLTQAELSERSGVALGTLKRFERTGEISFASLLALAEALDALEEFSRLFPSPEIASLDELEKRSKPRQRASSKGRRS
ncbi:helix-turn-helix domain-containing protein [Celeribacter sp. PS-C1]|uniref:helix-turn-helix domain-containing protein n=1 Tax=Celeribacter sp. PS-C1 TaxID=2820813 RepID=UPI00210856FC|nr:helix-turn-helix domain-containing protein [Celeribacter sp. PS-C1]